MSELLFATVPSSRPSETLRANVVLNEANCCCFFLSLPDNKLYVCQYDS